MRALVFSKQVRDTDLHQTLSVLEAPAGLQTVEAVEVAANPVEAAAPTRLDLEPALVQELVAVEAAQRLEAQVAASGVVVLAADTPAAAHTAFVAVAAL